MSDSLDEPKVQDDLTIHYSKQHVVKDDWVRRNLSVEVRRRVDGLGADPVPLTGDAEPDRQEFAAGQTAQMRRQAQDLQNTLASAPQFDAPEALEAKQGLGDFLGKLDAPNPDITALRKELKGLHDAVPLAIEAMAKAMATEREKLIQAADELSKDVAQPLVVLQEDLAPVQQACEAVGKALSETGLTKTMLDEGKRLLDLAAEKGKDAKRRMNGVKEIRQGLIERSTATGVKLEKIQAEGVKELTTAAGLHEMAQKTIFAMKNPTVSANQYIAKAVKAAEDAVPAAEKAVKPLLDRKQVLAEKLEQAKTPDDALDETKTLMQKQREKAEKALTSPLSKANLDQAEKEINELAKQAGEAKPEGAALGGKDGMEALLKPFNGDQGAMVAAFGGRKAVVELAGKMGPAAMLKLGSELGAGNPAVGGKTLAALAKEFDPATLATIAAQVGPDKLAALAKAKGGAKRAKELCDNFTPALLGTLMAKTPDAGLPDKLLTGFGGKPEALKRMATKGGFDSKPDAFVALVTKGCGNDPATFATLCRSMREKEDLPKLSKLLDKGGLGDAPDAFGGLIANGVSGEKKQIGNDMKQLLASFSDDTACADLKRVLDKAGLKGKDAGSGGTGISPDCLGHLLAHGHTATPPTPDLAGRCDALKALLHGLDESACTGLATMLDKSGLGAAPGAFAGIAGAGCDGKPGDLIAFTKAFGKDADQKAMQRALTDGGLAGKTGPEGTLIEPGCLGHLMRNGTSPQDPQPSAANRATGLATLLKGLDKDACQKLEGVLSEGGLGQAPRALGSLAGIGCEGKPADLKTFLGAFGSTSAKAALKRGVLDAGLGGIEDEDDSPIVDPSCLAQVLKRGHKEPALNTPAPNLATRCAGLRTLLEGMDESACGNVRGMLEDGAVGLAPEAAGHLVGLGCEGDPDKLKALAASFATNKEREKLRAAMTKGGFGPTKSDDTASGTNPECLGRLFSTGCEGKPDELKKLFVQLSPADIEALEGVMTEGGLGKHPKVLAKLYKRGCLDNPNGADNGPKNPKVLKDMVGGFKDEPDKFKDMLDNGGLGTASGEDRLGSLVRYGFTPKRPAGGNHKQMAGKLKKLQESFDGSMDDLKTLVDALAAAPASMMPANSGTAPGNQPGKGLQNVIHAPRFSGNPEDVHADFFETLETRAPPNPPPGNPARLSMRSLLQNAASFEHFPMADNTETIAGYEVRTGHIKLRHTRKYNDLDCNSYNPTTGIIRANKTTLYNYVDDPDQDVTDRVDGALNNLGGAAPQDAGEVAAGGGFVQFDGVPDGNGTDSLVGFSMLYGSVTVTQFSPETGTTINSHDMKAIGMALRTDRDAHVV